MLSFAIALPLFVSDGVSKENTVFAAEENVAYGDVNSDGSINFLDMIFLKSYLLENNTSHFSVKAADVDDDGTVSSKDAVELSMYLLEQIGSFSYEKNIDTDKDGLCDYIEKEVLGTDPLKSDSDGDGLSDYAEVYYCGTDPLSTDTDHTGTKDGDRDADNDKLTNLEEIKLGTSPASADTDEDGLSDYDEVKKYKTDPLKEDSDGDRISDFGEIKLGLDPLKSKTDGNTADTDRIFEQVLNEEDELLCSLNSEEAPFAVSVKTKSSGYLGESLDVRISDYTNYLSSDSILGDIIDFDYNDDFKLEELQISFALNDEYTSENYMIFKYSEELNMIFPAETTYDGNTLSVTDDCDGTYCLVDMDKWIENSDKSSDGSNLGSNVSGTVHSLSYSSSDNKLLDIYFLLYIKNDVDETKKAMAKALQSLIEYCNQRSITVNIYFFAYTGSLTVSVNSKLEYADNSSDYDDILNMLTRNGRALPDINKDSYLTSNIINNTIVPIVKNNKNASKQFYIVDNGYEAQLIDYTSETAKRIEGGVKKLESSKKSLQNYGAQCTIAFYNSNNKNKSDYDSFSDNSAGIIDSNFSDLLYNKIIDNINFERTSTISYNVNTGFCTNIPYNISDISEDWVYYYNQYYSSNLSKAEQKELLKKWMDNDSNITDSDGDGYPDFLEICMEYISFDENGNIVLPTYSELAKKLQDQKGFEYFEAMMKKKGLILDNVRILPLKSNPVLEDTDTDGIPDDEDERPNKADIVDINDSILDDSKVFEPDYRTINNEQVFGNGVVSSHTGDKKNNIIEYNRVLYNKYKITSQYSIEPNNGSEYLITVDTGKYDNCTIEIIYETGIIRKKINTVQSIELDDGYKEKEQTKTGLCYRKAYFLESGKKYQIYISVTSTDFESDKFKVSFEQNNWVYAPNGGIQRITKMSKESKALLYLNNSMNSEKYYLSEPMLYSVMAKLIGTERDLSDVKEVEKIMDDLGYDENDYKIEGKDIIVTALTDTAFIFSIYSFGASAIGSGLYAVIFADSAAEASAISVGITCGLQVITTPNLNLINKIINYWEKENLKDVLSNESLSKQEYNIYRSEDYTTTQKFWHSWGSCPYIRKINEMGDRCKIIRYNAGDEEYIASLMGWKK